MWLRGWAKCLKRGRLRVDTRERPFVFEETLRPRWGSGDHRCREELGGKYRGGFVNKFGATNYTIIRYPETAMGKGGRTPPPGGGQ